MSYEAHIQRVSVSAFQLIGLEKAELWSFSIAQSRKGLSGVKIQKNKNGRSSSAYMSVQMSH